MIVGIMAMIVGVSARPGPELAKMPTCPLRPRSEPPQVRRTHVESCGICSVPPRPNSTPWNDRVQWSRPGGGRTDARGCTTTWTSRSRRSPSTDSGSGSVVGRYCTSSKQPVRERLGWCRGGVDGWSSMGMRWSCARRRPMCRGSSVRTGPPRHVSWCRCRSERHRDARTGVRHQTSRRGVAVVTRRREIHLA